MLLVIGVDKGDIVPIIISIVYGSRAAARKLTSNTELIRSHDVKDLLHHIELTIKLKKSCLLLATRGSFLFRKTVIPSEAISRRKTVVPLKANPLLASENPDLVRVKRRIRRRI